jgi:uncharacterized protein
MTTTLTLFSLLVFAAEPRLITVTGDAELKVVPDQVTLSLVVETSHKDLMAAKSDNDERVKKIIALTQQFKIDPRHVQTDRIRIEPRYESYERERKFLGYFVNKSIVICLKDLSRFEELLTSVLRAGTNYVPGVQFESTELIKHRSQARLMAVKAAQEKAAAIAGQLGQKLGKPRTIQEADAGHMEPRRLYSNVIGNEGASAGASETFAVGQITINARVSVSFELAD